MVFLRFWASFGGLEATYDDHFRLIGKRVVDFLLVLIELFSLSVTAEALRTNVGSKSAISLQRGPVDPKFQVEGVAPTNHSSSHKTGVNGLSGGIECGHKFISFCHKSRVWQTDGRTDIILITEPCMHSIQRGKNEMMFWLSTLSEMSFNEETLKYFCRMF